MHLIDMLQFAYPTRISVRDIAAELSSEPEETSARFFVSLLVHNDDREQAAIADVLLSGDFPKHFVESVRVWLERNGLYPADKL